MLLHRNEQVPGYSVIVPELPGCFSQGRTLTEALENAREAVSVHIRGLIAAGEEVPEETEPFVVAHVDVAEPVGARA
ncbi:MAG: type II toxin-antitoxin system HicB family antitoxin [Chloroflexi bacterium]|nr:type II toxin-antitoxin system HicB family antitoxin [Chloroflexota bacterium]